MGFEAAQSKTAQIKESYARGAGQKLKRVIKAYNEALPEDRAKFVAWIKRIQE